MFRNAALQRCSKHPGHVTMIKQGFVVTPAVSAGGVPALLVIARCNDSHFFFFISESDLDG